jgi:hypothetical protein
MKLMNLLVVATYALGVAPVRADPFEETIRTESEAAIQAVQTLMQDEDWTVGNKDRTGQNEDRTGASGPCTIDEVIRAGNAVYGSINGANRVGMVTEVYSDGMARIQYEKKAWIDTTRSREYHAGIRRGYWKITPTLDFSDVSSLGVALTDSSCPLTSTK